MGEHSERHGQVRRGALGTTVGSSEQVAARLKELAKSLELDELVGITWAYDRAPSLLRTAGKPWFGENRGALGIIEIRAVIQ